MLVLSLLKSWYCITKYVLSEVNITSFSSRLNTLSSIFKKKLSNHTEYCRIATLLKGKKKDSKHIHPKGIWDSR